MQNHALKTEYLYCSTFSICITNRFWILFLKKICKFLSQMHTLIKMLQQKFFIFFWKIWWFQECFWWRIRNVIGLQQVWIFIQIVKEFLIFFLDIKVVLFQVEQVRGNDRVWTFRMFRMPSIPKRYVSSWQDKIWI